MPTVLLTRGYSGSLLSILASLRALEVNPRPAGGLFQSAAAGVDVGAWSALLALGLAAPGDVPEPTIGVHVAPIATAVIVRAGA